MEVTGRWKEAVRTLFHDLDTLLCSHLDVDRLMSSCRSKSIFDITKCKLCANPGSALEN